MRGGASKEKAESAKSETNISMIQFHWQSFGLGASSIVLGILALGLLILLICWFKLRCTKFFFQLSQDQLTDMGTQTCTEGQGLLYRSLTTRYSYRP